MFAGLAWLPHMQHGRNTTVSLGRVSLLLHPFRAPARLHGQLFLDKVKGRVRSRLCSPSLSFSVESLSTKAFAESLPDCLSSTREYRQPKSEFGTNNLQACRLSSSCCCCCALVVLNVWTANESLLTSVEL